MDFHYPLGETGRCRSLDSPDQPIRVVIDVAAGSIVGHVAVVVPGVAHPADIA